VHWGHRVGIIELHSPGSERIDIWRFDVIRSVTTNPFLAKVIDHDEEDIGLGWFRAYRQAGNAHTHTKHQDSC
jgi:hypothetical protein